MKIDTLVVTATLGDRNTLERTVISVREIGLDRVKHLIVAPEAKCLEIKLRFPFLEVIAEPSCCNSIYGAINYVFKSYGDQFRYMTFINDDDYWLNGFQQLFTVLSNSPSLDLVYGRTRYVDVNNNLIGEQTCSPRYKAFGALLSHDVVLFTQQATLFKSKLFMDIGGFDEDFKLIADTKFWLEAIEKGASCQYVNVLCAAYTIQQGQLSSNKELQRYEHNRLLLNVSRFRGFSEMILFRLYNFRVYLYRYFKYRSIVRMSYFFHSK